MADEQHQGDRADPMSRNHFTIRRFLAIGFVLILLLPTMQMQWRFVKESPLGGVESGNETAQFTLPAWLDGSFATVGSRRLSRRIGFRSICVRAVNQVKIALDLSQIRVPDRVTVGKRDWLFGTEYVQYYARPSDLMPERQLSEYVSNLATFQAMLADRGKMFVLVISPSKAELYPEYLPQEAVQQRRQFTGRRNYDVLVEELARQDINFVDAPRILRDRKPSSAPLFSRTGTHWNYYACFLIWQEVLKTINERSSLTVPVPDLVGIEYDAPRGGDHDLGDLLNVFRLPGGNPRVPYPVVHVEPAPIDQRPDFLLIGTSFTWILADTMYFAKTGRRCDVLYYYKTLFTFPNPDPNLHAGGKAPRHFVHSLQDQPPNWQEVLFDKEVVILEMLEPSIQALDWGFCPNAIAALDRGLPGPEGSHSISHTATTGRLTVR